MSVSTQVGSFDRVQPFDCFGGIAFEVSRLGSLDEFLLLLLLKVLCIKTPVFFLECCYSFF